MHEMPVNAYVSPPQAPLKFCADFESISQIGKELCDSRRHVVEELVLTVHPTNATFENVLTVILQHEKESQLTSNLIDLYSCVAADPKLRNAAAQASDKFSHTVIDCKTDANLFHLVDTVYQRQIVDNKLDAESHKALVEERRSYMRQGIGLISADNNQAGHMAGVIARKLQTIQSEFLKNLDEKQYSIWLTSHELAGVSDDALSGLEVGDDELDGKLRLDLKSQQTRWMLSLASSPATREKIYLGIRTVAKENVPLFMEAIRLRYQSAQLLGYANHMAYKLEGTMAKAPAAVMDFLESIRGRVLRQLPKDLQTLLDLKQLDCAGQSLPNNNSISWSEMPYYIRQFESQNYSVDQGLIAEHFQLHQTVSKMLTLFGKLFGFVFVEMTDVACEPSALEQGLIWHQDVKYYNVWNDEQEGGEFAGYLYLDLHPRPGKRGGAQCRPLQLGFERPDGQRHYPSTVLLANFSKPALGTPSLLQHSDVVLLFHELGHGMHDLAGRCKYSRFHGAEPTVDFNEAPSQMLENWCWDAAALQLLSAHYQTGDPLPDLVIESLLQTRVVLPAVKLMPQLRMTLFDTAVHSTAPSEDGSIDVARIYANYNEMGGIKSFSDEEGFTSYRHLFTGNDAGMYGYLWSKVLAMDMFDTAFKQDPLDGKVGRHYRHMVLEKGGSQDEMETLVQFLGRKPTTEAFYKSLGLD